MRVRNPRQPIPITTQKMGVFENDMIREKIKSYNAPDPINKHPEEETLMGNDNEGKAEKFWSSFRRVSRRC